MDAVFEKRINCTIFTYGESGSGKTHTTEYVSKKILETLFEKKRSGEYLDIDINACSVEINL